MREIHSLLQIYWIDEGKRLGYNSKDEFNTKEGRIDVLWSKENEKIAIEVIVNESLNNSFIDKLVKRAEMLNVNSIIFDCYEKINVKKLEGYKKESNFKNIKIIDRKKEGFPESIKEIAERVIKSEKKKLKINLKIDPELWKLVKIDCVKKDIDMSDYVEKVIREDLKRMETEEKEKLKKR